MHFASRPNWFCHSNNTFYFLFFFTDVHISGFDISLNKCAVFKKALIISITKLMLCFALWIKLFYKTRLNFRFFVIPVGVSSKTWVGVYLLHDDLSANIYIRNCIIRLSLRSFLSYFSSNIWINYQLIISFFNVFHSNYVAIL